MSADAPRSPGVDTVLRDLVTRVRGLERRLSLVGPGLPDGPEDGRVLEVFLADESGARWGRKITASEEEPVDPREGDIWLQLT